VIEYDEPQKAASPIPLLLDTIDKQTAIVTENAHVLADRLDKVLRPTDTGSTVGGQVPREVLGGSNMATRLGQVSAQLGELGVYLNQLAARLEL
jgi:hypothetical protein